MGYGLSLKKRGRELYSVVRTPFILNSAFSKENADEALELLAEREFRIEDPEIEIQGDDLDLEIEDETGLEIPQETVKLTYDSGMQMRSDFVSMSEEVLVEALSKNLDFPLGRTKRASLAISSVKSALDSYREGNDMMGANQLMLDSDLMLENRNQFAICPSNVERAYPNSQQEAETYAEIHEKIHAGQFENYNIEEKLAERQSRAVKEGNEEPIALLMTTLEGHAMYFGDKIASDVYDIELGEAAQSMLAETSEEKEDQYTEGDEFIGSLYEAGGLGLANHALRRPPETRDQLDNPENWYEERADSDILNTYWDIQDEDLEF